jgi:translation initiation factor IF-3
MIRIPQVRVVDEEGAQLGVMATPEALAMAQERGLDLVEVAPMAAPPVVKFLDFGQYKYELTKREKEAGSSRRSASGTSTPRSAGRSNSSRKGIGSRSPSSSAAGS